MRYPAFVAEMGQPANRPKLYFGVWSGFTIIIGFALLCFSLVLVVRLMRAADTDDAHRLRAAEPRNDDDIKPPVEEV